MENIDWVGVLRIVGMVALAFTLITAWVISIICAVSFHRETSDKVRMPWEKADAKGLTLQSQVAAQAKAKRR